MAAPVIIDRAGRRPTAFIGMSLLLIIDITAGALAFNTSDKNSALTLAALGFVFDFFWGSRLLLALCSYAV